MITTLDRQDGSRVKRLSESGRVCWGQWEICWTKSHVYASTAWIILGACGEYLSSYANCRTSHLAGLGTAASRSIPVEPAVHPTEYLFAIVLQQPRSVPTRQKHHNHHNQEGIQNIYAVQDAILRCEVYLLSTPLEASLRTYQCGADMDRRKLFTSRAVS